MWPLGLDDFWGKKVGITYGNQFQQGTLSQSKSKPSGADGFIVLENVPLYDEFRILLSAINGIGLFEKSQQ